MPNNPTQDDAPPGAHYVEPGVEEAGSEYLITVQVEPRFEAHVSADALYRLATEVLREEGADAPLEVGIVVTTDDEVHLLNRQYLGHDYKTDVISFGMQAEGVEEFVTPAERPAYLGDVVVSYERANEQAPEYGHSTEKEVATLVVHGLLHLLGYNDLEDADRERMHARQNELVQMSDFGHRAEE